MDKGPEKLKDVIHHFFELCNTSVHEGQWRVQDFKSIVSKSVLTLGEFDFKGL